MRAIGTAGSDQGCELALREGADKVVDHRKEGYREEALRLAGGKGFDVILEMLANANLGADLTMLAQRGRVVVIGSRGEATINPRDLMSRDAAVFGMLLWNMPDEDSASAHAAIVAGLGNGTLRPIVRRRAPARPGPGSPPQGPRGRRLRQDRPAAITGIGLQSTDASGLSTNRWTRHRPAFLASYMA